MSYKLADIELSEPLAPIELSAEQNGVGLIARWKGRLIGFEMVELSAGSMMTVERLKTLADERFAGRILVAKLEEEL